MPIILDEMMDPHITRRDMLPLSFLKMSSYTGSKRQLNYKLEKTEIELVREDAAAASDAAGTAKTDAAETKLADVSTADAGKMDAAKKSTAASEAAGTENAAEKKAEAAAGSEKTQEPEKITVLRIYSWAGHLCFDATPKEEIDIHDVEFSDDGIDAAIEYLNGRLETVDRH